MNVAFELYFRYLIIFSSFFFIEQGKSICHCQCDDPPSPSPSTEAKKDAKTIVDSKLDPKVIAKILPYRSKEQCQAINGAIASLNGGKNLVPPDYEPLNNTSAYQDLLFALVNDVLTVFSKYMGRYLDRKDETMIIMIYAQIDDREGFKAKYDEHRKNWDDVSKDKLEDALMRLPGDQAQGILNCYGKDQENPQPSIVKDINNHIHNDDLKDLYKTLVRYIQDANDYLAEKLHDYCDGRDNWAMWIIVVTRCRQDTAALDQSFQKRYNGVTLKKYLDTSCTIQDTVLKDMLKALVDPDSQSQRVNPPPPPPPIPVISPALAKKLSHLTDASEEPPEPPPPVPKTHVVEGY